jgi:polysaccharide export outer membrane protein
MIAALLLASSLCAIENPVRGRGPSASSGVTKCAAASTSAGVENLVLIAQDDADASRAAKKPMPRTQAANTTVTPGRTPTNAPNAIPEPSNKPDPNDYIIGEQDYLTITVWKEKELSGSVVVRPDGKITVPLVGETKVIGMTPIQVQNLLEEKLKPYIAVPQVTVAVNQINSRRVYLIGQVVREGSYQINSSTTVLQLIAQAGGLRDFAKRKNIYILRQQGSQQSRYSFNYEAVVRGRNQDQNILLEPGDTIVVP